LINRIAAKQIDFVEGKAEVVPPGFDIIMNIAEVLQDYPELAVTVTGHASQQEASKMKPEEAERLAMARSAICIKRLYEAGFLGEVTISSRGAQDAAPACVRISVTPSPLLEPQQRLDFLVSRCSFGFEPGVAEVSAKGQRVAAVMARVLREVHHPVTVFVPRTSSSLGVQRADNIAQAIKNAGDHRTHINVSVSGNSQPTATVLIEEPTGADEESQDYEEEAWDPQVQLMDILRETPLAFRPNAPDLVADVLPVVRRCAEVLKKVDSMVCLVEAFSGQMHRGDLTEQRVRTVVLERAHRIVDHLQAEGVRIPCYAKGYSGAYGNPGAGSRGPCIVLTLVKPGEETLANQEYENDGLEGCSPGCVREAHKLGCVWVS
jgi:outer membrane protein OmpA-like peptidoglycan-associated protein